MKKTLILIVILLFSTATFAQSKTSSGKSVTVKEWKTSAKTGTRYMDEMTKYNAKGQKIEQIEYANYGQKSRTTYEYDAKGNCVKHVLYDSKNKVVRIRKFEYYEDGSKKKQYNYDPDGKLVSTREFEYIFE
jgi:antitoxin component YwqK of YwqJK toxin-antitoxin module